MIYPKYVTENTEKLINSLIESNFFKENEIEDLTFATKHINIFFNNNYVKNLLYEDFNISDDEFSTLLKEIIAGSTLYNLINKGLITSYSDDDTEEIFFLSKKFKNNLISD
jgi:hypothetical protein